MKRLVRSGFACLLLVVLFSVRVHAKPGFVKVVLEPLSGETLRHSTEALSELEGVPVKSYPAFAVISVPEGRRQDIEKVAQAAGLSATVHDDWDSVLMPGATVATRNSPAASDTTRNPPHHAGLYVIQFEAPLDAEWIELIDHLGLTYLSYIPYNAILVYGDQSAVAHLSANPGVHWVSYYQPDYRAQPADLASSSKVGRYVVQLANTPDSQTSIMELGRASLSEPEIAIYGSYLNLTAYLDPEILRAFIKDPHVVGIERAATSMLSGEREAIAATGNVVVTTEPYQDGTQPYKPAGDYRAWLSTRNVTSRLGQQLIAIADTGLAGGLTFSMHPDFQTQLITWKNYTSSDPLFGIDKVGHGTMVAGFAAGNPSSTPQDFKGAQTFHYGMGLAPGARLFVQRLQDGKSGVLFGDINTWAQDAMNEKLSLGIHSVVQTHSHNDYVLALVNGLCVQVSDGVYTTESQQYDFAVRDKGLPITVSVGNVCQSPKTQECPASLPRPCPSRVLPPATAKNVLSVGASESYRPGMASPCDHETATTREPEAYWASTFNRVSFVSRQGTTDGRIKPDIVAPSSMVSSTIRHDTVIEPFCKKPDPSLPTGVGVNGLYSIDTGTSFAAPQAAGAMAVVNAFWGSQPALSPAALKAVLVGSSVSLKGGINDLWNSTINARPNTAQGFGRLNLAMALSSVPLQGYLDEASWTAFTGAGQITSRAFTVYDRSKATVIVLAWSDEPAAAQAPVTLVRDLNLEAFLDDGCTTYVGNSLHPTTEYSLPGPTCGSKKAPDSKNNVEMIVIPPNKASTFTLSVKTATWGGTVPQKFAVYYYNAYP